MTNEELRKMLAEAGSMKKSELIQSLVIVINKCIEMNNAASERVKADLAEHDNVTRLKKKYSELKKDYKSLKKDYTVVYQQFRLAQNMLFGTSSEKTGRLGQILLKAAKKYMKEQGSGQNDETSDSDSSADTDDRDSISICVGAPQDPVDEDADPDVQPYETAASSASGDHSRSHTGSHIRSFAEHTASGKEKKAHSGRSAGSNDWTDSLEHYSHFYLDDQKYNRMFGEGKWHISDWVPSDTLALIPARLYVDTTFYPVITPNDLSKEKYYDRAGDHPGESGKLIPGSMASGSLLAHLIDKKFENSVATYSTEKYLLSRSLGLSRSWITRWINRTSHTYLAQPVLYMQKALLKQGCSQSDETPWIVTQYCHGTGSKNYFWVHTSSELSTDPRMILFTFERGRATDHLLHFYGRDYDGVLEDDAFVAYYTFEKELQGKVTIANCFMHLRRRFVKAFLVLDNKGLTVEQLENTIEGRIIRLIGEIYRADNPLKKLSPEERLKQRQEKIKPLVDELFDILHGVDVKDPTYSSYLVTAVNYALNHEPHFKVFLSDPMVPLDNGFCERSLRVISRARSSFLFSTSAYGAEANAICYSLIRTAQENKAIPDIYLNYLLSEMPKYVDDKGGLINREVSITEDMSDDEKEKAWDTNWAFLSKMMPWSDEYKAYEKKYLEDQRNFKLDDTVKMPHVRKGKIVYTEITQEEAARYHRKRMKRIQTRKASA
ncbi:MAG: IS66 family transposase [Lachnospiraceae bacterium]|nr:IS66 family transposase [Lachnospiraceae bacterium]